MLFHKHKRALLSGSAFGQFIAPTDPMVMSAEGDGAGGAGDGGGDGAGGAGGAGDAGGGAAATFTQEDVNRMVANERRSNDQKMTALQTSADKVAGLETTIQGLNEAKELADTDAAGQATILAQRAADQHQAKIDELTGTITGLQAEKVTSASELSAFKTRTALSQELAKAGMLGAAAKHAVPAMMSEVDVTLTEAGDIATIKLGGIMQTDLPAAVVQFLTDNQHFKAAAPGGSGTSQPTPGAGMRADTPLHEQDDNALFNAPRVARR